MPTYAAYPDKIGGQDQTSATVNNILVPNQQITKTAATTNLIETANTDILANSSFENLVATTSWVSTTVTPAVETSVVIHGKKSLSMTASAQAWTLTQSSTLYQAQFADGVQGLTYVRIKTNHTGAVNVCAIQAGVVSTTLCVTVVADNKWALYKVPFILGATSNGISIAAASGTGVTYIDNAFVGAVDLKQDINLHQFIGNTGVMTIGATTTAPTKGTSTVDSVVVTRSGNRVIADYKYQQAAGGTNGTGDVLFTLPTVNGVALSFDSSVSFSTQSSATHSDNPKAIVGYGQFNNNSSAYINGTLVAYDATRFRVLTSATGGNAAFMNAATSSSFGAVFGFGLHLDAPVSNWSNGSSTYSANCGANCVDGFVADFTNTGTTSKENVEWVTGNASVATSTFTITIAGFTTAPACTVSINEASNSEARINSISSTTIVVYTFVTSTLAANSAAFSLHCNKTGADFYATRTIVGQFASPGAVAQEVFASTATSGTGTTDMFWDDTIPQITEGDEILTATITPIRANSKLRLHAKLFAGEDTTSSSSTIVAAVFRDSTANAVCSEAQNIPTQEMGSNMDYGVFNIICEVDASSTASTTFRLRGGLAGSGVAGTFRWNGLNGSRKLGGSQFTSITIKEIYQ